MPYVIVKRSGARPWKIIKKDTGEVVGSSTSRKLAGQSVAHREGAMADEGLTKTKKRKTIKKGRK